MKKYSTAQWRAIKRKLKTDFTYWYHRIDLGNGIITPGFDYQPLWDNIRKVRNLISYTGKRVLDIASFDGLWAFEAEQQGAKEVVATDCLYRSFRNFLFCKEVLGSRCIPYFNVSPYNLFERLDVYFEENYDHEKPYDRLFDIVQHLGLFYHLRDPLLSLSQARSCLKTGGTLLFETNVLLNTEESMMIYNGLPFTHRLSENVSVWWIPSLKCVRETLLASLFKPIEKSISIIRFTQPLLAHKTRLKKRPYRNSDEHKYEIGRLCLAAKAISPKDINPAFSRELLRTYRNPGMVASIIDRR